MPALPSFEIEKRLKKLEVKPVASTALVKKVGDQYEYDKDFIYVAYASALANLSGGAIPSQSDATDFQLTPYNTSGVLLAYRGYLLNKSVYQSGDPTDYIWESTSGEAGFTSSERYHTTSTGLQETLGNPTKPGTNITWTVINAGTAVPSTAVYVAERFTITTTDGAVTSEWKIKIVGKHIDDTVIKTGGVTTDTIASNAITSAKITADAITVDKMDLNGTLNVTAANGAIRWGKNDGDDVTNSGLFIGRNASSEPRFTIGSAASFIWFDGDDVFLVGATVAANNGSVEAIITTAGSIYNPSPTKPKVRIEMVGGGGSGGDHRGSGQNRVSAPGGSTVVKVEYWNASTSAYADRGVSWTVGGGQGGSSYGNGFSTSGQGGSTGSVGSNSVTHIQSVGALASTINDKPGNGDGGLGALITISTRDASAFNGVAGYGGGDIGTTAYLTSAIPGGAGSKGNGGGGAKSYQGGSDAGGGGGTGGYQSILYTLVASTDRIKVVSVGAGGAPGNLMGNGGNGLVRIIGST